MKYFFRYLVPYKGLIALVIICVGVQAVCEMMLPTLLANMINDGIVYSDKAVIWTNFTYMLALNILILFGTVGSSFLAARISTGLAADMRQDVFYKVQTFTSAEVEKFGTSSLITRSTNDVTQIQMFLTMLMRQGIVSPFMMITALVMAIIKGGSLALVLVVTIPVMVISMVILMSRGTKYFKSMQGKIDAINRVMRENLTGIRVIRAFQKTDHEVARFDGVNEDYAKTSTKTHRIMGGMGPMISVIMNITTIAVVLVGSRLVMDSKMDVGNLVAYNQYIVHIIMSIQVASMMLMMYPRASASAARVSAVMDAESSIRDGGFSGETSSRGLVEFKNVSFTYPGAEESVLKNISFTANPGETTAIIGSTGSGKSTLANLLPRFYDVTEGELLINGKNIKDYDLKSLREKIGYIPQKAVLFSGTIADNLRFGAQDATLDEMSRAADIAQATEFISAKEDGFDSEITQGATNISGGQKQRLSIARAVVKDPDIYLFDDSFSALDYKTDAALRRALRAETKEASVIIIAQRISTIMHSDKIVVLDGGEMAGVGTHKELLAGCSVYREIVESQFNREEIGE